ncbi:MAG: PQQ-like beta-propeller repeat protein, partial [Actinomycetota bacterium]|nr:PQQ-like beta-propeller repeat protein [Actinomycetota bacterium]
FRLNQNSRVADSAVKFLDWRANPVGCQKCAVQALLRLGTKVYFGGDFNKVASAGVTARNLAAIDAIPAPSATTFSAQAAPLGTGADGPVRALAGSPSSPSTLLVGGALSQRILALETPSGNPSPGWTDPAPDSPLNVLATDPSSPSVYAGGEFRSLGARARHGLAAFDSSGSLLDWTPDLRGAGGTPPKVHALAASNSTVYVGGQFDAAAGAGGGGLAALDVVSGAPVATLPDAETCTRPSSGEPVCTTAGADVLSLSLLGSTLYVGGAFDRLGGQNRANLAALDAGTGGVHGWNPGITRLGDKPTVHAILPACGAVYAGGWFDTAGGQARENLAALDPATGAATGWNPRPNGPVLALARSGPTIYAGGAFSHVGEPGRERLRRRLAGLNVSDGQATSFDANIGGQALGASVRALAVSGSAVYLGGHFADVAGNPRSHLAAVDPNTGGALGWGPEVSRPDIEARVDALALGDDAVYAGGTFASVGSTAQRGFAGFGTGAGAPFAGGECLSSTSSELHRSVPPPPAPSETDGSSLPPTRTGVRSPVLSAVALLPRSVVARRGARLRLTFRLSRAARVRLRFARRVRGRYVRFAHVTVRGRRGVNRVSFRRLVVGRRRLVPGRYRLRVAPLPIAAGRQRTIYFRVRAGSR